MANTTRNHIDTNLKHVTTPADAIMLAHHIVHTLHRPDYHPDDIFGIAEIDRLVDEAFDVCEQHGEDIYEIFYNILMSEIKKKRRSYN